MFRSEMRGVFVLSVLSAAIICSHGLPVADFSEPISSRTSTNTYAEAVAYAKANTTRDGQSWSGWCASLMWRAGALPESSVCASAAIAYSRSTIISMDASTAPYGAFHFWSIGTDGHVAMAMPNGVAMMASCHVQESWGECIGSAGVAYYTSATGARYLGWSYDYAKAEIADVHHKPSPGPVVPQSETPTSGVPDLAYYMRQQLFAARFGYTGDIDGVLGPHSWAGTQDGLRGWGYTGPDDGVPGTQTYMAMQRLAAAHGYSGMFLPHLTQSM